MEISQYWVGQIPARPLSIDVRDSSGRAADLSIYTDYKVKIVGSDNEELDLTGYDLYTGEAAVGHFVFFWPTQESLFKKSGDYLLQLEFVGAGKRDFTTAHHIRVHRLGGIR